MDPNQYASLKALDSDHLMEKVAEYQLQIDEDEATLDDLKDKKKTADQSLKSHREKIAMIARAQEDGKPIYQLDGGELTLEEPDSGEVLPFTGGADAQEAEAPAGEGDGAGDVGDVVDLGEGHPEGEVEEPAETEDVTAGL